MLKDLYIIQGTTFTVYRDTSATDSKGGRDLTPVANLEDKKGWLDPLSGSERIVNDREELEADYRLSCDVLDIVETDRAVVTSTGSGLTAVEFDIIFVETFDFGTNPHLEIYIKRRE